MPTTALHREGHAHSLEAWREGELVGGLYGVTIGRMFFGESMFARESRRVEGRAGQAGRHAAGKWTCRSSTASRKPSIWRGFGARPIARQKFADWLSRLVHSAEPAEAGPRPLQAAPDEP